MTAARAGHCPVPHVRPRLTSLHRGINCSTEKHEFGFKEEHDMSIVRSALLIRTLHSRRHRDWEVIIGMEVHAQC